MELINPDRGHRERVSAVVEQVRQRPTRTRITIGKNTPSHGVRQHTYKNGAHVVDVSSLDKILDVDVTGATATVEGQVQLAALCRATLEHGLLPAVVPEYRDFTVAGLINGGGIQSSSHRYGGFPATVRAVEVVLGDGSCVLASTECRQDLFDEIGGSWGTVGIVTAAVLQLVPAKGFVRSKVQRFSNLEDYAGVLGTAIGQPDFLEGVVFGAGCQVVVSSDFADAPDNLPVYHPMASGAPYYYQHLRMAAYGAGPSEEVIPTLEYLARSERGHWWMVECFANIQLLTQTSWGRRALERISDSKSDRRFMNGTNVDERELCVVLQDVGVRVERLAEVLAWVQAQLAVYPIWNCPIRVSERDRPRFGSHLIDVGLYGEPGRPDYQAARMMRHLQLLSDSPSLWGVSYLTREEFRAKRVLETESYEQARDTYHASDAFLHAEDKVVWIDPHTPARRKPPFWRLHLAYGPRWPLKPQSWLVLWIGLCANLVWTMYAGRRAANADR